MGQGSEPSLDPSVPASLPSGGSLHLPGPLTLRCRWEDSGSGATGFSPWSRSNCSCRCRLRPSSRLGEERASSWGGRRSQGWGRNHEVKAEGWEWPRASPGMLCRAASGGCGGEARGLGEGGQSAGPGPQGPVVARLQRPRDRGHRWAGRTRPRSVSPLWGSRCATAGTLLRNTCPGREGRADGQCQRPRVKGGTGEAPHSPADQGHKSDGGSYQRPPGTAARWVGAGLQGPPAPASTAEGLGPGQRGLPSPGVRVRGQRILP